MRNVAFWVVLFLLILALFNLFSGGQTTSQSSSITYSDFISRVEGGDVDSVVLDGERVLIRTQQGQQYTTIRPEGVDVADTLLEYNVPFEARAQDQSGFLAYIGTLLPFLILIGILPCDDVHFSCGFFNLYNVHYLI